VIAHIAIDVLLAIAAVVTVLSAVGVAVMRDPYQRSRNRRRARPC
jgi:multisubunit Na+/H+ antiporter MnhG subunit